VDGNNFITVSYDATTEANLVRAIALEITLSGNGEIGDVNCLSANFGYHIYLGSIDIDSGGTVQDYGTCKCDGSYPETPDEVNIMTVEMASLYEKGVEEEPCKAGDLVSFMVTGNDEVCASIQVNEIRGSVVMEDADEVVDVNTEGTCCAQLPPAECMMGTHPDYANWSFHNKPDCWCYHQQCRGDIDGLLEGPFPVSLNDVIILRPCFNQMTPLPAGCECADLDHQVEGPFWVSLNDVIIIRQYFNQMVVPDCDGTHINFWTN
jgi:hypothetical protein